jgi:hypothetical protein
MDIFLGEIFKLSRSAYLSTHYGSVFNIHILHRHYISQLRDSALVW